MRRIIGTALVSVLALALGASPATAEGGGDPLLAKQWHHEKLQTGAAWGVTQGSGALVAVVDTGVDLTHLDLQANLVAYPDADFVDRKGTDGPQDLDGHGTHVAGIVAALAGNGIGGAGIAPGAKILPVRVLDENGEGSADQIAAGIRYATDKGADVINLSLNMPAGRDRAAALIGELATIEAEIAHAWSKGALVVASAGNDSYPLCVEPSAIVHVVCVGALNRSDARSYYSNGDATLTETYLVAPGGWGLGSFSLGPQSPTAVTCQGEIVSTYLRTAESWCEQAGYEGMSGTSMASPMVAGVAALLASKGLDNASIVDCLVRTTDDLGVPGRDAIYGYGRVNAARAVAGCN